jgi:hypothetical protein
MAAAGAKEAMAEAMAARRANCRLDIGLAGFSGIAASFLELA